MKRKRIGGVLAVWFTPRALRDLLAIDDFIARDKPAAAARWCERLVDAAAGAGEHPQAGRMVPEFGRDDVREVVRQNDRIVYRILTDRIDVLTIFQGSRLPDDVEP